MPFIPDPLSPWDVRYANSFHEELSEEGTPMRTNADVHQEVRDYMNHAPKPDNNIEGAPEKRPGHDIEGAPEKKPYHDGGPIL